MSLKRVDWQALQGKREGASEPVHLEFSFYKVTNHKKMKNNMTPPKTPKSSGAKEPFPAWRVLNGLMNASEQQLESAVSSCERWEKWCGALVVLGVVFEFALAADNPPYGRFEERWGTSVADAFVVLGVMGEILLASMGAKRQSELSRRANNRLAQAEEALKATHFKLLLAEAKLEPRRLTPKNKTTIAEIIGTSIKHKVIFVIEQNEKANAFAWSIMEVLKECGVLVDLIPYKMPPGEKLMVPVMVHCPGGKTSFDDPLVKALQACRIQTGVTAFTTLSQYMPIPTPSDIGNQFSMFPTGSALPHDEYIIWVGEQSVFDDQEELARRVNQTFGPFPKW